MLVEDVGGPYALEESHHSDHDCGQSMNSFMSTLYLVKNMTIAVHKIVYTHLENNRVSLFIVKFRIE